MSNFNSSSSCDTTLMSVFIAGNQSSTFYPWALACWSSRGGSGWQETAGRATAELLPRDLLWPRDLHLAGLEILQPPIFSCRTSIAGIFC